MRIGSWREDNYTVPETGDEPAGRFTVTIKDILKDGTCMAEIIYENHPCYNRVEHKSRDWLYMWQWKEPKTNLPEDLFTI